LPVVVNSPVVFGPVACVVLGGIDVGADGGLGAVGIVGVGIFVGIGMAVTSGIGVTGRV
jgi:hypothetical protein